MQKFILGSTLIMTAAVNAMNVEYDRDTLTLANGPDRVTVQLEGGALEFATEAGVRTWQAAAANHMDWGTYWPRPGRAAAPEIVESADAVEVRLAFPIGDRLTFLLTLGVSDEFEGVSVYSELRNDDDKVRREMFFWGWTETQFNYQTRDERDGVWQGRASENPAYLPAVEGDADVYGWLLYPGEKERQWLIVTQGNYALCESHLDYIFCNAMLHASPREQVLAPGDSLVIAFVVGSAADSAEAERRYQELLQSGHPAAAGVDAPFPVDRIDYGDPAPEWLRSGDKYSNFPHKAPPGVDLEHLTREELRRCWGNTLWFTHAPFEPERHRTVRDAGMPCSVYMNWMEIYPAEHLPPAPYNLPEHPEWIALDRAGERIISGWGTAHNLELYSICTHSRALHARAVRQMREIFEQNLADGIFIDNAASLAECYGDVAGKHRHVPGKKNHDLYQELLRTVYAAVKSHGDDKFVMLNNGNTPEQWAYCDSGMAEEAVINVDWETLLYKGLLARDAFRNGKVPAILNYLELSYDREKNGYYSPGDDEAIAYNAVFSYVYARLFDMLWSAWGTLYEKEALAALGERLFNLDLSRPMGDFRRDGAVYYREFDTAVIVLNSDRRHARSAELELDGRGGLTDILTGEAFAGGGTLKLELDPYQALILVKNQE